MSNTTGRPINRRGFQILEAVWRVQQNLYAMEGDPNRHIWQRDFAVDARSLALTLGYRDGNGNAARNMIQTLKRHWRPHTEYRIDYRVETTASGRQTIRIVEFLIPQFILATIEEENRHSSVTNFSSLPNDTVRRLSLNQAVSPFSAKSVPPEYENYFVSGYKSVESDTQENLAATEAITDTEESNDFDYVDPRIGTKESNYGNGQTITHVNPEFNPDLEFLARVSLEFEVPFRSEDQFNEIMDNVNEMIGYLNDPAEIGGAVRDIKIGTKLNE